jgi:Icc-related predicted phosphoesterase
MAHATLEEEQDLAVCGLGVTIAEEALMREDCHSRAKARYFLRALRRSVKPHTVLLLPEPPPGVLGGSEGNTLIPDMIDEVRPRVCVVAGRTDRRGLQRLGSTLVVNPGALADDSAAVLEWDQGGNDRVELLGR